MIYRQLDNDWDYVFGQGKDSYFSGVHAVTQAIQTRLKLLTSEWWEDQEDGLPLFQVIIGSRATQENKQAADLVVKNRVQDTPGVLSVEDFNSTIANRRYSATMTVNTVYGTENVEVTL